MLRGKQKISSHTTGRLVTEDPRRALLWLLPGHAEDTAAPVSTRTQNKVHPKPNRPTWQHRSQPWPGDLA